MPKRIPEQELDAILTVVAAHPEGVRVSAIREGLPYELPPRMLRAASPCWWNRSG